MYKLIVLPALMVLAACGTTHIERPNTTQSQMQRDIDECNYEGLKASPYNALIARQVTVRCLKLRGYTW